METRVGLGNVCSLEFRAGPPKNCVDVQFEDGIRITTGDDVGGNDVDVEEGIVCNVVAGCGRLMSTSTRYHHAFIECRGRRS